MCRFFYWSSIFAVSLIKCFLSETYYYLKMSMFKVKSMIFWILPDRDERITSFSFKVNELNRFDIFLTISFTILLDIKPRWILTFFQLKLISFGWQKQSCAILQDNHETASWKARRVKGRYLRHFIVFANISAEETFNIS